MEGGGGVNGLRCHCQGGRLLIIIGPASDLAIAAARQWATATAIKHLHKMAFEVATDHTPTLINPLIPDAASRWVEFQRGDHRGAVENLSKTFRDCCFFEEVVLIAHGHQTGLFYALEDFLPQILDRPVGKLVIWCCGGTRETFPFTSGPRHKSFLHICNLVKPEIRCPCGCHHQACRAWNADHTIVEKCPVSENATVRVLSAGYYDSGGKSYPSPLSIDPTQPGSPFGAPEGRLIASSVTRDPTNPNDSVVTCTDLTGQEVFDTPVQNTGAPTQPAGRSFDPRDKIKGGKGKPPSGHRRATYQGPTTDGSRCPNKEGCLPGR
jgi:hypothetical protein